MLIRRVLRIVTAAASATYLKNALWSYNQSDDTFGGSGISETYAYLQFPVDVPAGTEIESAILEVTPKTAVLGEADAHVSALALFDGDLSTSRDDVIAFGLPVTWELPAWTANGRGSGSRLDITELVQSVIDRSGYAAGDLLTLQITAPGATTRTIWGFEGSPNQSPTLALVYDDGLEPFAPASDALSMIQSLGGGETVVYTPGHGDARTISAIIERSPRQYIDGMSPTHAPGLAVSVANHPTNGISSAEIDTAIDMITVPARYGRAAETRAISGINYHDFGMLELELA